MINLDECKKDWMQTAGPFQVRKLAEHYGVFENLFGKYAFFTPRVNLNILFKQPDDKYLPVYYGNRFSPTDAQEVPEVEFDHTFTIDKNASESLWTLIMSNPDGHLTAENSEYVHWMM